MNAPKHIFRIALPLIPLMVVIGFGLISRQSVNSEQPIPLPPKPEATAEIIEVPVDTTLYEPSRYGIPDTIGGYKVLAVITSENTECFPEGVMMIELQVTEPSPEAYMASNTGLNVQKAVEALGFSRDTVRWSISGPASTKEDLIRNNEQWNEAMRSGGCMKLGPILEPIGYATPSPTDAANSQLRPTLSIDPESTTEITEPPIDTSLYDPSYYGIPDTIAGYEVLVVITSKNKVCLPRDFIKIELRVPEQDLDIRVIRGTINQIREAIEALAMPNLIWAISKPDNTRSKLVREIVA